MILTTGRTGSELLVTLLNSHPDVMCDSEIFAGRRRFPDQLIRSRSSIAGVRGARAYGFKLVRDHLWRQPIDDAESWVRNLHGQGIAVILLERRDLLRQAISHVAAVSTQYHYWRGSDSAFSPARPDPMAVLATMFVLEDAIQFGRSALAGIPHLSLTYEDDLISGERQQKTVDRVCDLLELPRARVSTELVKVTPPATRDLIENFDELAATLAATRYARYLERGDLAGQPAPAAPEPAPTR